MALDDMGCSLVYAVFGGDACFLSAAAKYGAGCYA